MILRSASLLIISLTLSSCLTMPGSRDYHHEPEEEYREPEPLNNTVTKREWDLCCRICGKMANFKGLVYLSDSDTLQCRCSDGVRADIFQPDKKD